MRDDQAVVFLVNIGTGRQRGSAFLFVAVCMKAAGERSERKKPAFNSGKLLNYKTERKTVMGNVLKFLILGVGLLIVVLLIISVISVQKTGKNIFDLGMDLLTSSTSELSETGVTQYNNAYIDGSRLSELIKIYWQPDNSIAVTVCTKDGHNIMYDHDGATYTLLGALNGMPSSDAKGQSLANAKSAIRQASLSTHTEIETYDEVNGYGSTNPSAKGYINLNAQFKGSVQRDSNNTIRGITFVQQ